MTFSPTDEQLAIIDAAKGSDESLIIRALAGAAKTTTLELICNALPPSKPILSLAFNKRIAQEMEKRLPGHVKAQTLNSLGHRVWGQACTKRLVLNTGKVYENVKAEINKLKASDKSEIYPIMGEIMQTVRAARVAGYVPDGKYPIAKRLVTHDEFWGYINASSDEDISPIFTEIVEACLETGIAQSYQGLIDFDDQIYMPTLFGGSFPKFPTVMVDETQDLSALNHEMLKKLFAGRLIAVGDPYQSIYGFRGAVQSGMDSLESHFQMRPMSLSTSFRCPKAVVELARERAPHMQYPNWAKPGQIIRHDGWDSSHIPDHAAIICRNNAPLMKMALRLLSEGRGVNLVGKDIGPGLIKIMKKLGSEGMNQEGVYDAIDNWEQTQLRKQKNAAGVHDRAECLRVFASAGQNLGASIAYAEGLFKSEGPINILSGHKSKGLEWNHVVHLDPWRIPSRFATSPEELEQEANLKYVVTTRAKETLAFASLDRFGGMSGEGDSDGVQ